MTKTILLVEYDESTVNFIKDVLPPPMFEVVVANDGETAKRKLAGKNFDMMITAAMLPRFHGFNLALAVSQEYPAMKIVIISAIYKGFYYKHQATSQYRADDFFEKPLEKSSFKNRVLELLNISAGDLRLDASPATTNIPTFDTAKIPAVGKIADEEKQLSADDIFGDLIKKIDKVPQFKIDLNEGKSPQKSIPVEPVVIPPAKKEAETSRVNEPPDPAKTMVPTAPRMVQEARKPAASSQSINDDLDSLRQVQKKPAPETNMRKIEDDIARRFEDTLSGLGLGLQPPKPAAKSPAPAPAKPVVAPAPPAPEKITIIDELSTVSDDIIELGEESIQPSPPPAAIAAPQKIIEKEALQPETKIQLPDNPNELGDYVLLGLIARGGMAEIYKAKRKGVKGFEKIIAIKKILSGYGEDDKYIEMLVDEAKIAAELSHPNIIQIYDLGRKDNYYFIAMEYVLGKDLREIQGRLREKDQWFPEEISLHLTIKILEALNYAHKAKDSHGHALEIVHRDVSPPNVLISYTGDVKLTDFGISKASIKMHHTISGALKGKLLYMSPEQARGEGTIDCRSDLYSVGVVLFELLTSKKLFLDTSEMGVLKKVQNGEILNPSDINPDIEPGLEKIILKSLNKECEKRYQSAAAMIADLETFMVKKYNYLPGPVQLSHFIFRLFEKDIAREGIKVDLKPLPEKPLLREIPKAQPEPPKPLPVQEIKAPPPPPPPPPAPAEKPVPAQAVSDKHDEVVHIDFDEDKIAPARPKTIVAPQEIKKAPVRETRKAAPLFTEISEEKKKNPLWPFAVILIIMAAAALGYFLVLKKPAVSEPAAMVKPEVEKKTVLAQPQAVPNQPDVEELKAQAAANQKREEELQQQLQTAAVAAEAEQQKKLQEEKRTRQLESERLKKEETERLRQAELLRQQQEEAQLRQAEADRLAREAQEQKKAEELKEIERKRVKEGDVVPLGDVDREPQVISKPDPIVPSVIRNSLPGNQTVRFNILINQNGDVEVATLLQKTTNSQLNSILVTTIKSWKYTPASKDGVRVKVWKTVPLIIKK